MLENAHITSTEYTFSGQVTTTLGKVGTAAEMLPGHSDLVGEGRQEKNPATFHTCRGGATKLRHNNGKIFPCMFIWLATVPHFPDRKDGRRESFKGHTGQIVQ